MMSSPKKKKLNPMLINVLLISGAFHVLAILILGGITVVKFIIPDDAQFEEPPAIEEADPPKEVKVEIQPQRASVPQNMQSLKMRQVDNITVSAVDVNLPDMQDSFTVSAGLGGSIGRGSLLGGTSGSIGIGMSDVSVFGLKARAERILFVIDASREMVYDNKGGLPSYRVIKDEIVSMVANLSAGTLYNVMLVNGNSIKLFKPRLIPAGAESTQQLAQWLAPVNSSLENVGFRGGIRPTVETKVEGFEAVYEGLNQYPVQLAKLQYSLEMGVDAIFELMGRHDGLNRIRLAYSAEEIAKAEQTKTNFLKRNPRVVEEIAAHQAEIPQMRQRIQSAHAQLNKQRQSKGQPPKVLTGNVYHDARELGLKWEHPKPEYPELQPLGVKWLEPRNVRRYMVELVRKLYDNKGGKPPIVSIVLFLAGDEELNPAQEEAIEDYVGFFRGKLRILRGLNEIESASTAKDTKN